MLLSSVDDALDVIMLPPEMRSTEEIHAEEATDFAEARKILTDLGDILKNLVRPWPPCPFSEPA